MLLRRLHLHLRHMVHRHAEDRRSLKLPLPIPTDGPAIIRVNAREIDTQTIAYALHVDAGSLTATSDPSVWVLRI